MKNHRQENLKKAALSYNQSLRKNLKHRMEMAKVQGNLQLLRQLQAEAEYLNIN